MTRQTYEDGAYISYSYDNSGILTKQYDSATGRTTVYTYDTTGRLMKYTETGTNYSHSVSYGYDSSNNLSSLTETTNGVTNTTSYTYDDDNRVTSVTSGGVTKTYTYDAFGRVSQQQTKNGSTTILTETISYVAGTSQVSSIATASAGYTKTESYTYDDNGNIISIQGEDYENRYFYDSANQLIREDNGDFSYTQTWSYDRAGNIDYWAEYHLTFDELGEEVDSRDYRYEDASWGDLLTQYGNKQISYDGIGNTLSDGTWSYTWRHGRQLSSMTDGTTTWTYSYDADGMRTQRTNGTDTYTYIYNGSQLTQMTKGTDTLKFSYDANGTPMTVSKNGTTYYYATNLQGDVMDILDADGNSVASYRYDAWGLLCSSYGDLAEINPLRYRGYVYDQETGLYYLQSRYYNPELYRFINADAFNATGQGFVGNNMFAYCGNNPVYNVDYTGNRYCAATTIIGEKKRHRQRAHQYQAELSKAAAFRREYAEELAVLEGESSTYKGVSVISVDSENASFSFGAIFLSNSATPDIYGVRWLRHEYGHTRQFEKLGVLGYTFYVAIPSITCFYYKPDMDYYSLPWEFEADLYGGVPKRQTYEVEVFEYYYVYSTIIKALT